MKRTFLYFLPVFIITSFISCNKSVNNEQSLSKAYMDSIRQDSISREELFKSFGDTIFGNVLYGMDEAQASQKLDEFWNSLPKSSRWTYHKFSFAGIDFNKWKPFPIDDIKAEIAYSYSESSNSYSLFDRSIIYRDKLCSIVWETDSIEEDNINVIDGYLKELTKYFETKYGKPNSKMYDINDALIRTNGGRVLLLGTYALWSTHDREVSIKVSGRYPKYLYGFSCYVYKIRVYFYNTELMKDVRSFYESKVKEYRDILNEREKQDSIKTINAL